MTLNNNLDKQPKFFKVYISIIATLAMFILAAILFLLVYAGLKINSESKIITNKVNNFNSQVENINTNLQNINQQLKNKTTLPSLPSYL